MPRVLSKEQLFEELEQIVEIMNKEDFGKDPTTPMYKTGKRNQGDTAVRSLLKHFKKTTLYELDRGQMQEAIDLLHSVPIKGNV